MGVLSEIIEAMDQIDPDATTLDRAEELHANCGNYSYNFGLRSADTLVHVYVPELLDMGRKYVAAKRAIADLEASLQKAEAELWGAEVRLRRAKAHLSAPAPDPAQQR